MSNVTLTLVVGATGYLGSEIARHAGPSAVKTYCRHPRADGIAYDFFTDRIDHVLSTQPKVKTLIFASAVEVQPKDDGEFHDCVLRFVHGVRQHGVRLIYISSDAVFSGTRGQYSERDDPDAETPYGRHLRAFERTVSTQLDDYMIIRVSYLYGDTTTHVDRRIKTAAEAIGQERQFPRYSNVFKSPVLVTRAAREVLQLAQGAQVGVHHIVGTRTSIYDFYVRQCGFMGEAVRFITPTTAVEAEVDGLDTSLAHDTSIK